MENTVGKENIIYGVTDMSHLSVWHKMNNFLVDRQKLSFKDKSYLFDMLGNMIAGGVSIPKSFATIGAKTSNERMKRICNTIAHNVANGKKLSTIMTSFDEVFTEAEIALIEVGEVSATLENMLIKLSEASEKNLSIIQKINSAMVYPSIVILTMFFSAWMIFTFVVPKLALMFENSGHSMPVYSQVFFALGKFFEHNIVLILALIVLVIYSFLVFIKTEKGRSFIDAFVLELPLFGALAKKINMTSFARNLSYLLGAGVGITKALAISRNSIVNVHYQSAVDDLTQGIVNGEKLSQGLERNNNLFFDDFITMISVGERTATVAESAAKTADFMDREIDLDIRNMLTLVEPVMLIIVAIFVGWFVFAIFGAIFSLVDIVGNL